MPIKFLNPKFIYSIIYGSDYCCCRQRKCKVDNANIFAKFFQLLSADTFFSAQREVTNKLIKVDLTGLWLLETQNCVKTDQHQAARSCHVQGMVCVTIF